MDRRAASAGSQLQSAGDAARRRAGGELSQARAPARRSAAPVRDRRRAAPRSRALRDRLRPQFRLPQPAPAARSTAQGLIELRKDSGDGRVRRAILTRKGRAEVAAYDRLSDALAASILGPLDFGAARSPDAAMGEVERLLKRGRGRGRFRAPASADARWCLERIFPRTRGALRGGLRPGSGHVPPPTRI